MSFPAYPKYKDSRVAWLGKVPEHWELSRIGSRFTERRDKVSDTEFPPLSVTKHGIVPQLETAAKTDDNDNRKGVRAGDFVINSRSDRKGSSGLSSLDGSVSLINTVIRPDDTMHGAFVHHLLRSVAFQEEYYRYGKGIVADLWSTNYGEMKAITLAVPSIDEQAAIAAFLDRETAKIDALVTEQERLIALLKEKRQAVISHAVTKGLNPHAPMKDSGIEWLGEIPAHWEVVGLGRITNVIQTGPFGSQLHAEDYVEDQIPVINPSNLRAGLIVPDLKNTVTEEMAGTLAQHRLSTGEIILARRGEMGRCAVVSDDDAGALCGTGCLRISLDSTAEPSFIATYLATPFVVEKLKLNSVGATMDNLNASIVAKISTPRPPAAEQRDIMRKLRAVSEGFDALTAEAQAAITLLQERRAALISAAVTGKIDVRGLVDAPASTELETV